MKAVVCTKPGELLLEDRPDPARTEGHVLVRISRIGLCGTDFHIFGGKHPFLEYPRVMGHELSGEVIESDPANGFAAGDRVFINPYVACGTCVACRHGKPNCCTEIAVLGVHADGGMCEVLSVPVRQLHHADGLSLDQAAMVEFLSIGAHAVRRSEVRSGQRVLVVGLGPIGVGTAIFARLSGAEVTILDTNEARLAFAEGLGFERSVAAGDGADDALAALTDGEFFDVVFDATGSRAAIENGFSYVAHGGSYVLISVVKDDITFADPEFHKREMRLIGSRNATAEDFERVIAAIKAGDVPTDKLNTHQLAFDDAPTAIPALMNQSDIVMKAIMHL